MITPILTLLVITRTIFLTLSEVDIITSDVVKQSQRTSVPG